MLSIGINPTVKKMLKGLSRGIDLVFTRTTDDTDKLTLPLGDIREID